MERGSAIHGGRGCTAKGAPRGRGRGCISRSCPITPPLLPSSVAEGFAWAGTTGCGQQVGACGLGIAWAAWERRPQPARTCCLCSGSSLPPRKVLRVFSLPCSFGADSAGHSCKRPVGASGFQSAPSAPPGAVLPRPVFLEGGPTVLLPGVPCRWAGGHSVQMAALGGCIVSGSAPPHPRSNPGKWPGSNEHARLEEFGRGPTSDVPAGHRPALPAHA